MQRCRGLSSAAGGAARVAGAGARPRGWSQGFLCACKREVRGRRENRGERRSGDGHRERHDIWEASRERVCRGLAGPLVGLGLGLGLLFFSFFKFRNAFLMSSKIHKNSPKLFINKIFIFRLIIIILFNYYIIY
jgi:hypothetical protein